MCNPNHGRAGCGCQQRDCDCDCDCGGGDHIQRRYETKEEQISSLETYVGELKQELKAVEERIDDLRK